MRLEGTAARGPLEVPIRADSVGGGDGQSTEG